jgi:hypothetical protein
MTGSGRGWNRVCSTSWNLSLLAVAVRPEKTTFKFWSDAPTPFGMERRTSGYEERMQSRDDDDGLRSEIGQTIALFGMSLAVVLVGLLVGLGL